MKENFRNEKNNLNFMWIYDFQRLIATEKIIKEEKIEIQDIIPNNEERRQYIKDWGEDKGKEKTIYDTTFFVQNMVSWAVNFPDNSVRLIIHPLYSYMLNDDNIKEIYKIKNLDERKIKVKQLCEERIQEKYNTKMTLKEIEEKYEECFKEFEKEVQKYNKNFSVAKFEDLVNEYLILEEIENDPMLRYLVKEDGLYIRLNGDMYREMGSAIDAMRICLNYYGFGYEGNLTIDMDYSFGVLHNKLKQQLDPNNLGDNIKFPHTGRGPCENSLLYTSKSYDKDLDEIKSQCDKTYRWKIDVDNDQSIYGIIKDFISKKIEWSNRNGINNFDNEEKHLVQYDNHYFMKRSFNKENLISKEKTNLLITYEKNFWPQDEFFKKIREKKIYRSDPDAQKILHKIYEPYLSKSVHLNDLSQISILGKIS